MKLNRTTIIIGSMGLVIVILLATLGIFLLKPKQEIPSTAHPVITPTITQPTTVTEGKYQPTYGDGWYDGCPPKQQFNCSNNLDQMASKGFKFVINYAQLKGSEQDILAYANHANQKGMKIIWSLKDIVAMDDAKFTSSYPDILNSCGCSTKMDVAKYVVTLVKNLPATLGYYIADEPKATDLNTVVQLGTLVRQTDANTDHFRLIMISNAVGDANLEMFAKAKVSDIIGEDFYPIGRNGRTIEETATIASRVQQVAEQYGQKSAFAIQAHSLSQYTSYGCQGDTTKCPFPTQKDMTDERNYALQQPLALVAWYTYPKVRPNQQQWDSASAACGCK